MINTHLVWNKLSYSLSSNFFSGYISVTVYFFWFRRVSSGDIVAFLSHLFSLKRHHFDLRLVDEQFLVPVENDFIGSCGAIELESSSNDYPELHLLLRAHHNLHVAGEGEIIWPIFIQQRMQLQPVVNGMQIPRKTHIFIGNFFIDCFVKELFNIGIFSLKLQKNHI